MMLMTTSSSTSVNACRSSRYVDSLGWSRSTRNSYRRTFAACTFVPVPVPRVRCHEQSTFAAGIRQWEVLFFNSEALSYLPQGRIPEEGFQETIDERGGCQCRSLVVLSPETGMTNACILVHEDLVLRSSTRKAVEEAGLQGRRKQHSSRDCRSRLWAAASVHCH